MRRFLILIALFVICAASVLGQAPTFSTFHTQTLELHPIDTFILHVPQGELWVVDYRSARPSFDLMGSGRPFGPYLRFQNDRLMRWGTAGYPVVGKPSGWMYSGPVFLYEARQGRLSLAGFNAPNSRVTFPLNKEWRAGLGAAMSALQGQQPTTVLGPYLSLKKGGWLFQLRLGRVISPSKLEGRRQWFFGVTRS